MIGILASDDAAAGVVVIFFFIGLWVLSGWIGSVIGKPKGHEGTGWALGLLLGVIGWIIVGVMQPAPGFQPQAQQGLAAPNTPISHPPSWIADPMGRNQLRYWDGRTWTDQVANNGMTAIDPIIPAAPVAQR